MNYDYHIIVIGAGSGGLVVASGAAGLGAKVALIEGHLMGGDCLNFGCVPSKSFIRTAHLAQEIKQADALGLSATLEPVDMKRVMTRVKSVIESIRPHDSKERYEGLGVDVFEDYGSLVDKHTVKVGEQTLTAKNIVISTGSEPVVPPIPGLKECDYLTNKNIFDLNKTPDHLVVLGGGPIGLELGQGFLQCGSKVTVIDMLDHLFPNDDPEVGPLMGKVLSEEGMNLKLSSKIISVSQEGDQKSVVIEKDGKQETITGDQLLISLGRRPVTKNLNLEQVGVKLTDRGFLQTNARLQTSVSNIYGCGDVVGPFQFTHMAGYQAGIIIRNTIFKMRAKVDYANVPWVTFTSPEVAHVGYTEPWAKKENLYHDHVFIDLNKMDRAKSDADTIGFLKVILGKKGRLIGVSMVGKKAGEMMSVASLAIQQNLKMSAFMNLIYPYPTESEIYKFASLELAKRGFKPWMKRLIKKLLL